MSKALDYLVATRGDALGHYLAFLKECGKHLDPKTRSLISVITKVDAQTERGFRQYLRRALADGCTPATKACAVTTDGAALRRRRSALTCFIAAFSTAS